MRHVLGVDAGASKTHALLIDEEGRCHGFGEAGGGNHQVSGLAAALHEIGQAVRGALRTARFAPGAVASGCFCLAGADLPEDYAMLEEAIQDMHLAQLFTVKNDTVAALRAGLSRSWGVVVICGTGFNAAGRSPDGREIVLPGLGPISGDWGGGGALSQEMIRLVMRAWDGRGRPTLLTNLILEALQAPSVEDLLSRLYHQKIDEQQIRQLVPLLFEAAEVGDEVAKELIMKMGKEVGVTANALIRRLSLDKTDVEVVLGGSVFKGKGSLLMDTVSRVVQEQAPRARIVMLNWEPVVGAALLALESLGVSVNDQVYHFLGSTLPAGLVAHREGPPLKG